MTDEVSALVLGTNRLQALALSIAQAGRAGNRIAHPPDRDAGGRRTSGPQNRRRGQRRRAGRPRRRTRADPPTGRAHVQRQAGAAVPAGRLLPVVSIRGWKTNCWPPSRCDARTFRAGYSRHRLRREMIATKLANRMINRLGLIHPFELAEEEGATLARASHHRVSRRRTPAGDACGAR